MRGPVLAGELGRDLRAILPGLGGGEGTHRPRGEGITASGGRDSTWVTNGDVDSPVVGAVVVPCAGWYSYRDEGWMATFVVVVVEVEDENLWVGDGQGSWCVVVVMVLAVLVLVRVDER